MIALTVEEIWVKKSEILQSCQNADNPNGVFYRILEYRAIDYLIANHRKIGRFISQNRQSISGDEDGTLSAVSIFLNPLRNSFWRMRVRIEDLDLPYSFEFFDFQDDPLTEYTVLSVKKNITGGQKKIAKSTISVLEMQNFCVAVKDRNAKRKLGPHAIWEDVSGRKLIPGEVAPGESPVKNREALSEFGNQIDSQRRDDCVRNGIKRMRESHPAQSQALRLKIEDFSIREIAGVLNKTYSATTTFLSAANKLARPFLEPCLSLIAEEN